MAYVSRSWRLAAQAVRPTAHRLLANSYGKRHYSVANRATTSHSPGPGAKRAVSSSGLRSPRKDFYEYHLQARLAQTKIEPIPWILDRDPDTLLANIPDEFKGDALAVLHSAKADIELVGQCLEAFIVKSHSVAPSQDVARDVFVTTKIGTQTLRWLIASGNYEQADLSLNPRFLKTLIHGLAAEKGHDFIWDWIRIDHTPRSIAHLPIRQNRTWKGVALMELVKNDVFWHNGNAALLTFLRAAQWSHGALNRRDHDPPAPGNFNPCHQAGIWLWKRLVVGTAPDTALVEPRLYDDFIHTVRLFERDPWQAEMSICNLFLAHPTQPNAELAYLHIMSWDQDVERSQYMNDVLESKHSGVSAYLRAFVLRTAQMLRHQNIAAAKRVLDVGERRRPYLFRERSAWTRSSDVQFAIDQPPTKPCSYAPARTRITYEQNDRARAIREAVVRQGYVK